MGTDEASVTGLGGKRGGASALRSTGDVGCPDDDEMLRCALARRCSCEINIANRNSQITSAKQQNDPWYPPQAQGERVQQIR